MRLVLIFALVLAGCASKKAVKNPSNSSQKELDQDKSERDSAKPDDKDDADPKKSSGDPCEGGE